ncbi:M56 family metallopeptidase [Mucilaginibacter rubeus]|uniref:TonB family protein n=1 Tax=Mucilaginibacter rubeus TaxID=2027860 RepID=A0A5C1HRK0_9SPHI|nr:M56 family metallopeptidase [Mucilaginibacter rubeus]QEM08512.1 TonB family protein [Mucilaginibacter rubeus]
MNWLHYLAEANIYLSIFYLVQWLLMRGDTHYQLKRFYILFGCIVAYILPVLQVGALKPAKEVPVTNYMVYTIPTEPAKIQQQPASVSFKEIAIPSKIAPIIEEPFTFEDGIWYAYLAGVGITLILFLLKMFTLFRLARNKPYSKNRKYKIVYLPGSDEAFSFFNYLFIGTTASASQIIIRHELVHIRQKHSADIMLLEFFKIINWFNPFLYLLQSSLRTLHEYIADEQTASETTDRFAYATFLLNNAYGTGGPSITQSFFTNNLLKKRLIMLNKQRSGKLARLKYLVTIPVCSLLLCSSTLVFSKNYGWFDLDPAKKKMEGRYNSNHLNHGKQKLLKVTQNGVTTITNQLTVNQANGQVLYTANSITEEEKLSLSKKQHMKVEVVEDSTVFTTTDGRLMLPVVGVDGYYQMDHFLHKHINFNASKDERGGLVEVGFGLDNNRHITDAKIVKSGGAKLDALALDGFRSYKGIVNDDPGRNYKIVVYFFTHDYSIFQTDSLSNDPEFAGELIITNYKYPISTTSKGYEYDESPAGPGYIVNGKPQGRVIIYDKNDEGQWYYQNKCTADDFSLLKNKYGYTFPSASTSVIQFMHPENVKKNRLAYIYDATSYLATPYSGQFYNHVIDSVVYPEQAKKALKGGVVILGFNLNGSGMISDIKVEQGGGNGFDEAAVNALQSYKLPVADEAGRHSIAIVFCVAEKKYRPSLNRYLMAGKYVGELAVPDMKPMFKFGRSN